MTTGVAAGRRLLVRADASVTDGTGHLMRSLALAEGWMDEGGSIRWLVGDAPEALLDRIRAAGIELIRLAGADRAATDGAGLREQLAADPSAVAVVDGYAFGSPFFAAMGTFVDRVLLIDDLAALPSYPMALVLNQNAHADRADYPADSPARFLLGLRYLVLRREFAAPPPAREVPPVGRRLLGTFGGLDPAGLSLRLVDALRLLPAELARDLEVRLVVGAANPAAERIHAAAAGGAPAIDVRVGVTDMAAQLAWADLAVTSGGTTVWELARMGCPALVIETVPAEVRLAEGLRRLGLFDTLGEDRMLDATTIARAIEGRLRDPGWRSATRALGMDLVDGIGTNRVVRELAGSAGKG